MSTPNADAWELAGFPGRLDVAAYLTADQLAAQYRVLVDVLLDAQEHSLTGVGRDELLAAVRDRIADATDSMTAEHLIRPEAFDLDARMRALQDWKVVIRWQDKAKTEADFIRTRDRYQLTIEAADLHRWLRRKIDEDAVSTSAAAFAPAIIAERLDETIDAIGQRDLGQAAQAWAQVRTTLKDMAEAASIWQSRMASPLAGAPDADKMSHLRETLIAYVTVWGAVVDTYSPRIRDALSRLRQIITDNDWRAMALSGIDATATEETVRAIAQGNRDAADTLSVWFGERTGQALRLRRQVRDAVTPLLRGSRALLATGGRVTRRAELLRLAAAVESAESDADAWKTRCAATGLWSARHVSGVPDEPEVPARTCGTTSTKSSRRTRPRYRESPSAYGGSRSPRNERQTTYWTCWNSTSPCCRNPHKITSALFFPSGSRTRRRLPGPQATRTGGQSWPRSLTTGVGSSCTWRTGHRGRNRATDRAAAGAAWSAVTTACCPVARRSLP
jgi:hypothetical protein